MKSLTQIAVLGSVRSESHIILQNQNQNHWFGSAKLRTKTGTGSSVVTQQQGYYFHCRQLIMHHSEKL